MSDTYRTDQPSERLTRLCAAMTAALDAHPERGDERCIVFLQEAGGRGGLQMHGYPDDFEAMADLLIHLQAIFEANGKQLIFAPIGGRG